jgi:hypothetical protein
MRRITIDRTTLGSLRGLTEPSEVYDESGRLLGTFTPAPAMSSEAGAPADRPQGEGEAALGPEMSVFGRETDLE